MMKVGMIVVVILLGGVIFPLTTQALADHLRVGFYNKTCPNAETIIRQVVRKRFHSDRSITAALLRMHFHDCFVKGCDASILIDSTKARDSEKDAGPNQFVRGYETIDEAKKALEAACPGTVSCADIIAVAARDSVSLAGGPSYNVPTGRRDGFGSDPSDVDELPGPALTVAKAFKPFKTRGFTLTEMVTLLGAHSIGVAHCGFFFDRLSNFKGTGKPDPTMDPALMARLNKTCETGPFATTFLDHRTSFVFDNEFYKQILEKKGIMQIDQELATHSTSSGIVSRFAADNDGFMRSFKAAMVKLGTVEVLTGTAGEIRKNCRVFNKQGH